MKFLILVISIIMISFSSFAKEEYLSCNGDPDSTWGGYTVHLKNLERNKVMGVLLEYHIFSKDTYTKPFELDVKVNHDKTKTYSNQKHEISFTVSVNGYSGQLQAEAYERSKSIPSFLLCEEMDEEDFYFWNLDPMQNSDTDLRNILKLYHLK